MSQHDGNIANQNFPTFRSDLNDALAAILTNSSGATAPSTTFAYQWWYDTTTNTLKMRNADNDAWITIGTFDQVADTFIAETGNVIDAGTAMLFQQTAAPTGWTKQTTHNNKALRIVSGSVVNGGNAAFTSAFASYTPSGNVSVAGSTSVSGNISIGNTTLTTATMPSHSHVERTHTSTDGSANASGYGISGFPAYNIMTTGTSNLSTLNTGSGGAHSHSASHNLSGNLTINSSSFTGNAKDLAVQYVDVIIATKDA